MSAAGAQSSCDKGIAQAAQSGIDSTTRPNLVLATTILASSLAFIDGSVVNVGLPAIQTSLSADGSGLSWVINGYLLPLSALLLIGGGAGDIFGRRRLLILGVALFALASILCAAAPSLTWLVAGRVIQGVGAALLMPNSLAILGSSFTGEARGRAIGTWAAVGAGAGAVGPLIGGWLIDAIGWRAIFFVNLPIAAGAIALAVVAVRDDRTEDHPPLDIGGAILAAAGLTALTWGLTDASIEAGLTAESAAALAAGAIALAGFIWLERRRGDAAMLPLNLFESASFVGLSLLTILLYGALGGLLVLIPYVLIETGGYSATLAGAALLPFPLVIALTSSRMGRLAGRIGGRLPLSIGPVIVAAGCLLGLRIGAPGSYWTTTLPAMLVISAGMAGAVAPLTTAVLSSVEARHTGVASGFNSALARTGGLLATAFASVVLAAHGVQLLGLFHAALIVAAGASLAAGACAYQWVRSVKTSPDPA